MWKEEIIRKIEMQTEGAKSFWCPFSFPEGMRCDPEGCMAWCYSNEKKENDYTGFCARLVF